MTDLGDSSQQNSLPRPPELSAPAPSRDRDRHVRPGSPETGASSYSGTLMNSAWTTDAALAQRPSEDEPPAHANSTGYHHEHDAREPKRSSHHHRSHKHKSTGAFLLSDPFVETTSDNVRVRKRKVRGATDKTKPTSKRPSNEHLNPTSQSGIGLGLSPDLVRMGNGDAHQPGTPPRGTEAERAQKELQTSPSVPSPRSSSSSMDMDSTQIVSMALNLSESRRLAQRRVSSQPMPPRLAPLPTDNTVAGALRQQLQQQRRASRGMSPKLEQGPGKRVLSTGKLPGSLQSASEPTDLESSYRYHFSNSTLARAQKAKDHMELLSQYRRVLELLPPLKSNSLSKSSTLSDASPFTMPMSLDSIDATGQIGRPYDPLQYIRNRKVRARERKTIDGESQGFGDVNRVTDWVDEVAKWVATRQFRTPGSPTLPPFSGADVVSMDSPPTNASRPSGSVIKPKRPRNDWVVDPADMLADIYWLEQDDHKRLVEDRNWKRVFPQDLELYRPRSRATGDPSPSLPSTSPALNFGVETGSKTTTEAKVQKSDNENFPASTREKARQKLQELRGFHRHTASSQGHNHNHGLLRGRRSSMSSSSDSEHQKQSKRVASGDTDKDIFEKQMMEMMAREPQDIGSSSTKLSEGPELRHLKTRPSYMTSGAPFSTTDSTSISRQHSHRESRMGVSDIDDKNNSDRSRVTSPQRPSRESLEVPPFRGRRMSFGSESSVPNSPEYRLSRRDNYFMPGIGADLSPTSSRPSSPSRNPFSKVKQIFRDRSRERTAERLQEAMLNEKEGSAESTTNLAEVNLSTPELLPSEKPITEVRSDSAGPDLKLTSRTTGGSQRSHRKTNSIHLGDPGAGLRNLFKGPRIDSVLKSGVSKVSELLWKKESEAEESDPSTLTSDDSDNEIRQKRKDANSLSPTASLRGRSGQAKQERHYLDVMPPFTSTSESKDSSANRGGSVGAPLSKPASHRSTRFELLRPPRIDISIAADGVSSADDCQRAGASDTESRLGKIRESVDNENRRPSMALSIGPLDTRRTSAGNIMESRNFSISEIGLAPKEAPVSRREVARLRALMLSSGVMAMEISRRAHLTIAIGANGSKTNKDVTVVLGNRVNLPEIMQLAPEEHRDELLAQPVSQVNIFPVTAHILGSAMQSSRQRWQSEAESLQHQTRVELIDGRIEQLRQRLQLELTAMTRTAAEEADEVSGDLVDGQRRKIQAVVDVIDKLFRRRRRRFRWVRRAGWLALEWLLVGLMWYVWFVVMIARIFLGIGKGFVNGVKWLLWL